MSSVSQFVGERESASVMASGTMQLSVTGMQQSDGSQMQPMTAPLLTSPEVEAVCRAGGMAMLSRRPSMGMSTSDSATVTVSAAAAALTSSNQLYSSATALSSLDIHAPQLAPYTAANTPVGTIGSLQSPLTPSVLPSPSTAAATSFFLPPSTMSSSTLTPSHNTLPPPMSMQSSSAASSDAAPARRSVSMADLVQPPPPPSSHSQPLTQHLPLPSSAQSQMHDDDGDESECDEEASNVDLISPHSQSRASIAVAEATTEAADSSDEEDDDSDYTDHDHDNDNGDDDDECVGGGLVEWVSSREQCGGDPRAVLRDLLHSSEELPISRKLLWRMAYNLASHIQQRVERQNRRRRKLPHINSIDDVCTLIHRSHRIVVLTGAGISVSAGIPDFRSKAGIYPRLKREFGMESPESMFDLEYFRANPAIFYSFAKELWPGAHQPTLAHRFIRALEQRGKLLRNYTQNIDALEMRAGIKNVLQCHGSFARAKCMTCERTVNGMEIHQDIMAANIAKCTKCHPPGMEIQTGGVEDCDRTYGVMKPCITFFGESLPSEFRTSLAKDRCEADLVIVMGSSLKVHPVAGMIEAFDPSVPMILINREVVGAPDEFDVEVLGCADEICEYIANKLGWELPPIDPDRDIFAPINQDTTTSPTSATSPTATEASKQSDGDATVTTTTDSTDTSTPTSVSSSVVASLSNNHISAPPSHPPPRPRPASPIFVAPNRWLFHGAVSPSSPVPSTDVSEAMSEHESDDDDEDGDENESDEEQNDDERREQEVQADEPEHQEQKHMSSAHHFDTSLLSPGPRRPSLQPPNLDPPVLIESDLTSLHPSSALSTPTSHLHAYATQSTSTSTLLFKSPTPTTAATGTVSSTLRSPLTRMVPTLQLAGSNHAATQERKSGVTESDNSNSNLQPHSQEINSFVCTPTRSSHHHHALSRTLLHSPRSRPSTVSTASTASANVTSPTFRPLSNPALNAWNAAAVASPSKRKVDEMKTPTTTIHSSIPSATLGNDRLTTPPFVPCLPNHASPSTSTSVFSPSSFPLKTPPLPLSMEVGIHQPQIKRRKVSVEESKE